MDVGGWLRKLGLERYEPVFREHAIYNEVLPELSEATLRSSACRSGTASDCSRPLPPSAPRPSRVSATPPSPPDRPCEIPPNVVS
jgi:hypothetical protein